MHAPAGSRVARRTKPALPRVVAPAPPPHGYAKFAHAISTHRFTTSRARLR
ncbi:Uncharacterised protein [Amycolatopsis camponoti]|uniref:Uncharacterized protein n=1 Tax=Amycolatopsis camponoti TaxID=2606593 RepID=A0A6I8LQQ9_9PSEU|nr:Uncharacterised protein [Amycolatopsis camponoti]